MKPSAAFHLKGNDNLVSQQCVKSGGGVPGGWQGELIVVPAVDTVQDVRLRIVSELQPGAVHTLAVDGRVCADDQARVGTVLGAASHSFVVKCHPT
jgi:hypothetical protein